MTTDEMAKFDAEIGSTEEPKVEPTEGVQADVMPEPATTDSASEKATPTIDELMDKLTELETSNNGLKKGIQAERQKRQEYQSQVSKVEEMIRKAEAQRTSITEPTPIKKIDIQFDDDGNAFIPASSVDQALPESTVVSQLTKEIAALKQHYGVNDARTQQAEQIKAVLSQDEGFPEAYKTVDDGFELVKGMFDDYIEQNGIDGPKTADAAIDIALSSPEITKAFESKFPGADLELILEAKLIGGDRRLKRALKKHVPGQKNSSLPLPKGRPQSLQTASSIDQSSSKTVLERVADMSGDDFLNMSDAEFSKFQNILKEHEST